MRILFSKVFDLVGNIKNHFELQQERYQHVLALEAAEARVQVEIKAREDEHQARLAAERQAEEERQKLAQKLADDRSEALVQRFRPIANPDEYYAPNGSLYLEASADDHRKCIIGFGLTGDLQARLAAYQSKSTGDAKRHFLKTWRVWNMALAETMIKEMLAPWANPEEKQKLSHSKNTGLSKIELFDLPFASIEGMVDRLLAKYNEMVEDLRETVASDAIIEDAEDHHELLDATPAGPLSTYKPINVAPKPAASALPDLRTLQNDIIPTGEPAADEAPEIAAARAQRAALWVLAEEYIRVENKLPAGTQLAQKYTVAATTFREWLYEKRKAEVPKSLSAAYKPVLLKRLAEHPWITPMASKPRAKKAGS
jgi:hypothetical protein